ncbi:hypothetical protein LEP1GSC175_2292 [Leptospira santarosai str. HAI821]|nr:hypothetical protein LEP1GSC039_2515 [Leptospira santarosai str. 2000027870]EMO31484.1 hypothetical protein LEP1GSC175_2292 [Leptospira santarosai str. HAI821]
MTKRGFNCQRDVICGNSHDFFSGFGTSFDISLRLFRSERTFTMKSLWEVPTGYNQTGK